ncbi:MAG TPA: pectate lyase [Mucilaginibacter sp.]
MKIKGLSVLIFGVFMINLVKGQNGVDTVAENMLLYQRAIGGWPKAIGNIKVDYHKTLSPADRAQTMEDAWRNDATMDNDATYKEINHLIKAYKKTGNKVYLEAAERGIRYLIKAQNANGGWPQFYPDSSLYRADITFNDDAMINSMNVLYDVGHGEKGFDVVDHSLIEPANEAVKKGIVCILKTQVEVKGKLTAWCQQYDKNTLRPAPARTFELVGLSGNESVGVVEFLMRIPNPSSQIKNAVKSAVEWFNEVKIRGYKYVHVASPSEASGRDAVLTRDTSSIVWARFYEIDTNRPFFAGRNSIKKYNVSEIENERRIGYGWYGMWPQQLINKDYPEWAKKNGISIR